MLCRPAALLRRLATICLIGLTQHVGLAEDVLDHRLNSRTVYMNPMIRFIYWNMNYHVEHHMFPMVPYHALPRLHEVIKHDCPTPYPSSGRPTARSSRRFLRQLRKERPISSSASCRRRRRPYRERVHERRSSRRD